MSEKTELRLEVDMGEIITLGGGFGTAGTLDCSESPFMGDFGGDPGSVSGFGG